MFQSQYSISGSSKKECIKKINNFITKQKYIYCKAKKRKVSLEKFIEVALTRSTVTSRLQCFFPGVDILKHSKAYSECIINGCKCFEVIGFDQKKKERRIHIREEVNNKDKQLMLISIFKV